MYRFMTFLLLANIVFMSNCESADDDDGEEEALEQLCVFVAGNNVGAAIISDCFSSNFPKAGVDEIERCVSEVAGDVDNAIAYIFGELCQGTKADQIQEIETCLNDSDVSVEDEAMEEALGKAEACLLESVVDLVASVSDSSEKKK